MAGDKLAETPGWQPAQSSDCSGGGRLPGRMGWDRPRPRSLCQATIGRRFRELLDTVPAASIVAVDIPISLPERGWRRADVEARRFLGKRSSSVFATPPRAAVEASSSEEANPRAVLGRCAHLLGETAGRLDPAGAAAPLPPMLDDPRAKRGQVEDLANLDPVTGVPASSPPQPPQRSGIWTTNSSGSVTCARCAPGVPGCLPGRRPPPSPRAGRVALARPSEDGGLEEFEESFPSRRSSSATRACKVAIRRACSAVAARSSTMTAAWTATVASSSGSEEGITASKTTSGHARLPKGRTAQLPHQPPARQLVTARSRCEEVLIAQRGRVTEPGGQLGRGQLDVPCPACPQWTTCRWGHRRSGQGHRPGYGSQQRPARVPARRPMPTAGRPFVGHGAAARPEHDARAPGSE